MREGYLLAVVEVDLGENLFDELLKGEFEVVPLLPLEEEALDGGGSGVDAEEEGASLGVQKGDDGLGDAPLDGVLLEGDGVVPELDRVVAEQLLPILEGGPAADALRVVHLESIMIYYYSFIN